MANIINYIDSYNNINPGIFLLSLCGFKKIGSEENGCKCTLIGAQFCKGGK